MSKELEKLAKQPMTAEIRNIISRVLRTHEGRETACKLSICLAWLRAAEVAEVCFSEVSHTKDITVLSGNFSTVKPILLNLPCAETCQRCAVDRYLAKLRRMAGGK